MEDIKAVLKMYFFKIEGEIDDAEETNPRLPPRNSRIQTMSRHGVWP